MPKSVKMAEKKFQIDGQRKIALYCEDHVIHVFRMHEFIVTFPNICEPF